MKGYFENRRGLTLVELLIVLALLSIILIGVVNLFSFILRTFDWVEGETQRQQEVKRALSMLGNDIRNARPLEDQLIGVAINQSGTELLLGPEGQGCIRYQVRQNALWRQVHDGHGFTDQPGKILDLVVQPGDRPFQRNEKTVFVHLRIDYSGGRKAGKLMEITAEFTVRNGLLEKED
ncbi:MAG TPA: prepilin-type N-terminal cleavage/methylation domain-containing protein [Clostridia bacterium]|nr:prepilin-type N-terminal cleavage/methylation domain-containing protein [Clostridia bacterium]